MYGTEPGDSSRELKETETDNDDAENERSPLNTVTEESCPILCEAVIEDDCHRHAIYVIVRSGRSVKEKWTYPPEKRAHVCRPCKSENSCTNVF